MLIPLVQVDGVDREALPRGRKVAMHVRRRGQTVEIRRGADPWADVKCRNAGIARMIVRWLEERREQLERLSPRAFDRAVCLVFERVEAARSFALRRRGCVSR